MASSAEGTPFIEGAGLGPLQRRVFPAARLSGCLEPLLEPPVRRDAAPGEGEGEEGGIERGKAVERGGASECGGRPAGGRGGGAVAHWVPAECHRSEVPRARSECQDTEGERWAATLTCAREASHTLTGWIVMQPPLLVHLEGSGKTFSFVQNLAVMMPFGLVISVNLGYCAGFVWHWLTTALICVVHPIFDFTSQVRPHLGHLK